MFIQIIQGMCRDPDALHRQMDMWRQEIGPTAEGWLGGTYGVTDDNRFIGGCIAMEPDGHFTETVSFRSEEAAHDGESKQMPDEMRQAWEDEMALMQDVTYLDLRHPWFASKA